MKKRKKGGLEWPIFKNYSVDNVALQTNSTLFNLQLHRNRKMEPLHKPHLPTYLPTYLRNKNNSQNARTKL